MILLYIFAADCLRLSIQKKGGEQMKINKIGMLVTVPALLLCCHSIFAQETQSQTSQREEIVLTTYYPVPYGDYDKFLANRIAVGDTTGSGQLSEANLPPENGQLYVAKSVIYKPQDKSPTTWVPGIAGELAFSKDEGTFYYYNGSDWVAQSGKPGIAVTMYGSDTCPAGWETMYTGVAMTVVAVMTSSNSAGGGGIVCKAGQAFDQHPEYMRTATFSTGWYSTNMDNGVPCAVCVK